MFPPVILHALSVKKCFKIPIQVMKYCLNAVSLVVSPGNEVLNCEQIKQIHKQLEFKDDFLNSNWNPLPKRFVYGMN